MREKQQRLIVTFRTTTGAMAMEKAAGEAALPGRLIPVPRCISAGCGLCWASPPDCREELEKLVVREKLDVDGIYTVRL